MDFIHHLEIVRNFPKYRRYYRKYRQLWSVGGFYLARGWLLIGVRRLRRRYAMPTQQAALATLLILLSYSVGRGAEVETVPPEPVIAAAQAKPNSPIQKARRMAQQAQVQQVQAAEVKYVPPQVPLNRRGRYAYGHCTYYIALKRPVPAGWGNARTWYSRAQSSGFKTGSEPAVGAIAWTSAGRWGHVAYVEQVDQNRVLVSEMNWRRWNRVTRRWVQVDDFKYIY